MTTPVGVLPLQAQDPIRIGPFAVQGRLGAGAMGQVFLGSGPGGRVAVKVVHHWLADVPQFRVRFVREVAAGRRVRGPWTARVVDADPDAEEPWLATEYVAGVSLAAALEAAGPFPPSAMDGLAGDLARALDAVHSAGLVHRDVKPGNVMLTAERAVLIDFGIARALEGTRLTSTGVAIGTPAFMSPEQVLGERVGPASDVFSLGALLVVAASGRGPFGRHAPMELLRRITSAEPDPGDLVEPLRSAVTECLRRDPDARPGAAELVARWEPAGGTAADRLPAAVAALLPRTGGGGTLRVDPAPTEVSAPGRRLSRRAVLGTVGGIGLVGGLAAIGAASWSRPADQAVADPFAPQWRYQDAGDITGLALGDGTVVVSSADAAVVALDQATGQPRWTFRLSSPTGSLRAVGDVVIGYADATLALDAARGTLRWQAPIAYGDPVAAADGVVLTQTGASAGDGVVALDAGTGTLLWSRPMNTGRRRLAAATGPRTAFVADVTGLVALDLRTGTQLWSVPLPVPDPDVTGLAAAGDTLLVHVIPNSKDGDLTVALDATTGRERWRRPERIGAVDPPVPAGDAMYAEVGGLQQWDLATGRTRWACSSVDGHAFLPGSATSVVVAGDVALVGDGSSDPFVLRAFSADSGAVRWRLPLDGPADFLRGRHLAAGRDSFFVSNGGSGVQAFALRRA